MDRLLALPIPGDAYLLQRDGKSILVDGGHASSSLTSALHGVSPKVTQLDIVVCTHADLDHAGGLVQLLDDSTLRVGEFWLPGEWGEVLPGLLRDPQGFLDALLAEFENDPQPVRLDRVFDDHDDFDDFEEAVHRGIARDLADHRPEQPRDVRRRPTEGADPRAGLDWLKRHASKGKWQQAPDQTQIEAIFLAATQRLVLRASLRNVSTLWEQFWLQTIRTAERIRQIASQAIRHDVPVRWFDFMEFARTRHAAGGEPGLLVPLNAVELIEPPVVVAALRHFVRLTPVNEQSLAFISSKECWLDGFDVVFCGDSPLGDGHQYEDSLLPKSSGPKRAAVATAPHHGSESNQMAYTHLNDMTRVRVWLRAGGSNKHPGATFQALQPKQRACTHCPHLDLPLTLAEIQLTDPEDPARRACSCNGLAKPEAKHQLKPPKHRTGGI